MKKILWGMLITFLLTLSCIFAAEVKLQWDANTESDLAGYKVYYGQTSRNYGIPIDVGNITNAIVTNLTEGMTYYFAATAYSDSGLESPYSIEVVYTIPVTEIILPMTEVEVLPEIDETIVIEQY